MKLNEAHRVAIQRELASRSFVDFVKMAWPVIDSETYEPNWHMDVISDHLMAAQQGEINRLLFNVPPGTSKSSAASVYFPAWLWGPAGSPHTRFIGASHEQSLATRDNRRTRLLIESEWFQQRWPTKLTTDQNEKQNFENDRGGFRQSCAVRSMTGKRGHFVVWDDPQNPEDADSDTERETAIRVMSETLPSRMVSPKNSVIIVIMQRLHMNDVSGHILEKELGYTHVMLPMEFEPERRCYTVVKPSHFETEPVLGKYDGPNQRWYLDGDPVPEEKQDSFDKKPFLKVYNQDPRTEDGELLFPQRFPRDVVDRDNKAMTDYGAAGQQQQRPVPRTGGMFDRNKIEIIPALPPYVAICRGWDLAASKTSTSAFTAGVLMAELVTGEFVIANVKRERIADAGVEMFIKNNASQDAQKHPTVWGSVPQDPGAGGKVWGKSIVKTCSGFDYRLSPESGDKVARARPLASQVQIGNVKLVAGGWNEAFLEELGLFPASKYKDQVDAASRAFAELNDRKSFDWYAGGD